MVRAGLASGVHSQILEDVEFTENDEGDTKSLNDTVDGMSEVDAYEVDERIPDVRISLAIREALFMLDAIHLPDVFRRRATDECPSQNCQRSVRSGFEVGHERRESGTPRVQRVEANTRVKAFCVDSMVASAQTTEGWFHSVKEIAREV